MKKVENKTLMEILYSRAIFHLDTCAHAYYKYTSISEKILENIASKM